MGCCNNGSGWGGCGCLWIIILIIILCCCCGAEHGRLLQWLQQRLRQ